MGEALEFGTAFHYPFTKWKRLFNILWLLLPLFGWFAIFGYQVRLVQRWSQGKYDGLPRFDFFDNLSRGFFTFLKVLPLMIAISALSWIVTFINDTIGGLLIALVVLLLLPMLVINIFVRESVSAGFDFDVINPVVDNIADYILAILKDFALAIIFFVLSFVLVGIPAASFTKNIFITDFYRRHVK